MYATDRNWSGIRLKQDIICNLDNFLVTVEEFEEEEFQKYVNNTGECMSPAKDELS